LADNNAGAFANSTVSVPLPADAVTVTYSLGFGFPPQTVTLTAVVGQANPNQLSAVIPINVCVPAGGPVTATATYSTATQASPGAPIVVNLIVVAECEENKRRKK
jgi:hypothetical protein